MPNALRAGIQVVFQDPYGSFNPSWRVEHLVAEPFHLLDEKPAREDRRDGWARRCKLSAFSPRTWTSIRTSFPAGSANASPSRGR